ncbi:MAG: ParA family protein [Clostridia bacterium]|nr:ParA family protein [Clostridia bacterium]
MHNNQILAVWGSPASGKTLTSVKIANMLSQKKKNVVILFCDLFVPVIPVILPYYNTDSKSLGNILSSAEITQDKIFSNCLTLKKNSYLSFLGYQKSESVFTYPAYTKSSAVDLMIQLRHIADYIIVDCTSHISADILSTTALEISDAVLRLGSCDLKGVSYFSSQLPYLFERRFNPDRHIKILSNYKMSQPETEIKECYNGVDFELPYLSELEEQYFTGRILEELKSKSGKKFDEILKEVLWGVFNE